MNKQPWIKNKNNLILIGLLALLGYYLATTYLFRGNPAEEVEIDELGFSVDKLVVEKGTTVTWINTGNRPHWPASNFHPLHNYYPVKGGCLGSTFDACRGLERGETFSFTLNELGVWPMHDHLAPGLTMVVEVVEDKSKVKESSFDIKSMTPEALRLKDYGTQLAFIKQISKEDPAEAWEFLKSAFMVNGSVVGNAHEMSHIIGNELYKQEGLNGIRACDTTFAYGCMHGVTEAMLMKEGVEKVKSIEERCLQFFPPEQNLNYTGCIHGMGHGLYTFSGADLKQSLTDCDIVSQPYRNYCYDGVFMENSSNPDSMGLDPKEPWKLCAPLSTQYHHPCAKYQSQIFLSALGGGNISEVGNKCGLGPTELLKETCYQSLGYYVAQTNLGNPEKIKTECKKITDTYGMEICSTGGAIETIFQKYENWKEAAQNICSSLPERSALCFDRINVMINKNEL